MKKLNLFLICFIFFIVICNSAFSQYPFEFTCGSGNLSVPELTLRNPYDGAYKPNRTDTINSVSLPPNAYFPVLIVFVQYSNDVSHPFWPNVDSISGPIYKDSLIAQSKNASSEWWNAYNQYTQVLSDYYIQVSRGKFHVIGKVYSVVLPHDSYYYQSAGEEAMVHDIWRSLNHCYDINWPFFDKWGYDSQNNVFTYGPDGNIDFIYKVNKTVSGVFPNYAGFNQLAWYSCGDFEVDTVNHKWIKHGSGYDASGITVTNNVYKEGMLSGVTHEHGHYISSPGHLTYGKNSYGVGFDAFYSPYEMIFNGYMYPRDAVFGQTNTLGDYSSRSSNGGEIIKVPISETECFLLANRRKVSHWDRVMMGDTALYNTYNDWEYGKGLYIYHVFNGIQAPTSTYSVPQDEESADGFYRWDTIGKQTVYMNCWTSEPVWWVYKKAEVLYTNDPSTLGTTGDFIGDELSLHHFLFWNQDGSPAGMTVKFSIGKIADNHCLLGTDKIFTNTTEYFSNFNHMGTRWDAWNVGYNEVFSPYSSPSTATYNNSNSGIFIRYKSLNTSTNEASIDIYKVGSPYSETQILQMTPPSRPMGLKADSCVTVNNYARPYITWVHNREPDMERNNGEVSFKRYKLFRTTSVDYNTVPSEANYSFIATVDIPVNDTPYYIDTSLISGCYMPDEAPCPPWCWIPYFIRYRVQAVDYYDSVSVKSDFASTLGIRLEYGQYGGQEDDNPGSSNKPNGIIPRSFDLKQNYPNPFNPVTNIKFDLPKDIFVTIKIYDILGREVKTLINEFKNAGSYIISFNGSELASGVYFYRIQAGSFVSVKRMVLIK